MSDLADQPQALLGNLPERRIAVARPDGDSPPVWAEREAEQLRAEPSGACPAAFPVSASQSQTVPSNPPETTRRPSGLNRASRNGRSHDRASRPPVGRPSCGIPDPYRTVARGGQERVPSLRNSTQLTGPSWARAGVTASPVATSQIRAVWSAEAVASRRPVGSSVAQRIVPS